MHQGEGVRAIRCTPCWWIRPASPPYPNHCQHSKGRNDMRLLFSSGDRILFSSTHETSADARQPRLLTRYVCADLQSYEFTTAKPDGSDLRR